MKTDLARDLRRAIEADGRSWRQLAKAAHMALPVLSRFIKGERDLRLKTATRVAAVLGLELRKAK